MIESDISFPVQKAVSAWAACATTSVGAVAQHANSFLPNTLGEWASAVASILALLYTLCLLGEFVYKKLHSFLGEP